MPRNPVIVNPARRQSSLGVQQFAIELTERPRIRAHD